MEEVRRLCIRCGGDKGLLYIFYTEDVRKGYMWCEDCRKPCGDGYQLMELFTGVFQWYDTRGVK